MPVWHISVGLFARHHEQSLFEGEALVAENGIVVYSGAFGLNDRGAKLPYTTNTPSCVASLSKPITAVALVIRTLPLQPGFSSAIGVVTARQGTQLTRCPVVPWRNRWPVQPALN